MGMQPPPKGDISQLWNLLGVDFAADQVVWQDYNPYPKLPQFAENPEFVFVGQGGGAKEPFSADDPISSGLQQVLFPFPGAVAKLNASTLQFTPLVQTGEKTGTVRYADLMQMSPIGPRGLNPDRRQIPTGQSYVLAAHIQGKVQLAAPDDPENAPADKKDKDEGPAEEARRGDRQRGAGRATSTCSRRRSSGSASRARFPSWASTSTSTTSPSCSTCWTRWPATTASSRSASGGPSTAR